MIILLDRIRSMHNVGAFFRTADGAGVEKLILSGYTPFPPRNEISKTALHAEEVIPWVYMYDEDKVLEYIREQHLTVVCIERTEGSVDYRTYVPSVEEKKRLCFVFGNEVEGVHEKYLRVAAKVIHLPMVGMKESLNVSVCAGVIMYHYMD